MSQECSSSGPPPSHNTNYTTKPKLTKAERRELQERQRAAKAALKQQQQQQGGTSSSSSSHASSAVKSSAPSSTKKPAATPTNTTPSMGEGKGDGTSIAADNGASATPGNPAGNVQSQPTMNTSTSTTSTGQFHLYHHRSSPSAMNAPIAAVPTLTCIEWKNYHPAVLRLGEQYANYEIIGGNRRCRAMLDCYKLLLQDCCGMNPSSSSSSYSENEYREFVHHEIFKPAFDYWTTHCRPHSVAMGNAFSFLKSAILVTTTATTSSARQQGSLSWNDLVKQISESIIDSYIRERIEYADKAIAEIAVSKIIGSTTSTSTTNTNTTGDLDGSSAMITTILTFRYSEAVVGTLVEASIQKKKIHVVVVEDRTMLHALRRHDISCEFVPFAGLSYALQQKDITFVLLGASALMSDGCVWGSIGTAVVALAAHSGSTTRPPVLVCAETYKISNRVQLDSWIFNEQQHHQQKAIPKQSNEKSGVVVPRFNLRYDLTPAELVDGIITELGIVPPTSVAVLLREMNPAGTQK